MRFEFEACRAYCVRRPCKHQKARNDRSGIDWGIEGLSLSLCGLASRESLVHRRLVIV